ASQRRMSDRLKDDVERHDRHVCRLAPFPQAARSVWRDGHRRFGRPAKTPHQPTPSRWNHFNLRAGKRPMPCKWGGATRRAVRRPNSGDKPMKKILLGIVAAFAFTTLAASARAAEEAPAGDAKTEKAPKKKGGKKAKGGDAEKKEGGEAK